MAASREGTPLSNLLQRIVDMQPRTQKLHSEYITSVQSGAVQPLTEFRDSTIKELERLRKRYQSARLERDSLRRSLDGTLAKKRPKNEKITALQNEYGRISDRLEALQAEFFERSSSQQARAHHEIVRSLGQSFRTKLLFHKEMFLLLEELQPQLDAAEAQLFLIPEPLAE